MTMQMQDDNPLTVMERAVPVIQKVTLSSHLGTLVRRWKSANYEVCFNLQNGEMVINATCSNRPVPLDHNATVKELVVLGERMYAKAVWRSEHHQAALAIQTA